MRVRSLGQQKDLRHLDDDCPRQAIAHLVGHELHAPISAVHITREYANQTKLVLLGVSFFA